MEEAAQNESSTNEAPIPKPTPSTNTKPKMSKKPIIITSAVGLVLIVLVALGIYLWQQGIAKGLNKERNTLEAKVVSQSAQLKTLEKSNKDLSAKVNFLDKALKEATAAANIEFGELTISVSKTSRYDGEVVVVDLTIKNETDQTLFFSVLNLKLKDSKNKSYLPDLPPGNSNKSPLKDQQVIPGETIVGSIAFWSVPATEKIFTLLYNTEKFTITVK